MEFFLLFIAIFCSFSAGMDMADEPGWAIGKLITAFTATFGVTTHMWSGM